MSRTKRKRRSRTGATARRKSSPDRNATEARQAAAGYDACSAFQRRNNRG